jgi:hypothetical protein
MGASKRWLQVISPVILLILAVGMARADSDHEIQPGSAMSGIISGTLEGGKLLLAANDKVIVDLKQVFGIKPGDYAEIFQPLNTEEKEKEKVLYKKVGLGIILENIDGKKAVLIIDSSIKEITVGDLVRLGAPR